ncbi:MAG TPA: xanthine dehydrogenase family protein subunit M [Gemmatimonadaceae bacterium]|nr:xanthine dehydrogenase family protein subunit M [Gemmatimonadaceae bacterium]
MRPYTYRQATSFAEAARLTADTSRVPLGGGTDLLVCIEEGLIAPSTVVDLRAIEGASDIRLTADGGLRIGAGARIEDISEHEHVVARCAALSQACGLVGSTALRNMGTLGGNLCQRPRCWYYRRGIPCLKNGGVACPARDGENQYHAILDGGPCYIVHPSDPAVALTALDAQIEIVGPDATRRVGIDEFYVLPRHRIELETILQPGDIVAAVTIPGEATHGVQFYRKLMQRGAWDFALASVAGVRRRDGAVRIVLGGVAPRPWRAPESVEEDVASGGLDEDSIAALAERALYDAEPLAKNAYKVALAASLLRDAMRELTRDGKTD